MLYKIEDLRKSRIDAKITQVELARVTGLHISAITRIESGKLDCRVSTLELLNDGLNIIKNNKHRAITGVVITDKNAFGNIIYRSIIKEFEELEHSGKYNGNGHHFAQRIVEMIVKEFKTGLEDEFYEHEGDRGVESK